MYGGVFITQSLPEPTGLTGCEWGVCCLSIQIVLKLKIGGKSLFSTTHHFKLLKICVQRVKNFLFILFYKEHEIYTGHMHISGHLIQVLFTALGDLKTVEISEIKPSYEHEFDLE